MLEMKRDTRDTYLERVLYARISSLGSKLNSKVAGGPFYTMIRAFIGMLSDLAGEIADVFAAYDPMNSTGPAQKEALAFFGLEWLRAAATEQTFTIFRESASGTFNIPVDATVQTGVDPAGKTYSYKIASGDESLMPGGVFFATVTMSSVETGLVTALTTPRVMQLVSGLDTCVVIAGTYTGGPPVGLTPETASTWLLSNESFFEMEFRIQGRDDESDDSYRERCLARWDEVSSGSTAASYESWARSFKQANGNAPVSLARVSSNQVFNSTVSQAPTLQPLINGQEYIMGVEVVVAFSAGNTIAPSDLKEVADALYLEKPHTDKVWVRGPTDVPAGAGAVLVTIRAPAALQAKVLALVSSFFIFDPELPGNYQGLGATIYKSEIIAAVKAFSTEIEDVKVDFDLAGKLDPDGNIALLPFDQITFADPMSAIMVVVH